MQHSFKNTVFALFLSTKTIALSALIGVVAGLVCVLYRLLLAKGEVFAFGLYGFVAQNSSYIPLLFIGLAVVGYLVGMLIARYPTISGSGVPQVTATIMGRMKGPWPSTLLAKLISCTVSIMAGLSLGRAGPSIHLGACVGQGVAGRFATSDTQRRVYLASGASAGLAATFHAPLSGVMFVIEGILKYFSPMVLLSTMAAALSADYVSSLFFGLGTVFNFPVTQSIPVGYYGLFLVLGVVVGLSGVVYNICLAQSQKIYARLSKLPQGVRIVIPFLMAGVLGITFPIVLCGGNSIIEALSVSTGLSLLVVILVVKFFFTMVSAGSGAPGGIFFPLLVMGATIGAIFAKVVIPMTSLDEVFFYNFVIIAMAGYFTAIVRTPLTGIVLLVEMTGSLSQLLPLIITSAVAYVVAEALGSKPVYQPMLERLLASLDNEAIRPVM